MLSDILPLIPSHTIYTEAFFGGGAVFFAKEPVRLEVINDTNNMVVNFYEVLKTDFDALKNRIEATLFSRTVYRVAYAIYQMPHLFSKVQQAWAFYITTNLGFSGRVGSWAYNKSGGKLRSFNSRKIRFDESIAERLHTTEIESNDACKVIESRDTKETFHYVDPPYIGANQGHYGGYTEPDFEKLLDVLSNIEGKFLLSSYGSELLSNYTSRKGWHTKVIKKTLSAPNAVKGKPRGQRIEVLTANYPI